MDKKKKEEKKEVELVEEQGSEWFPDRSTTTATLFWICWRNKELPRQSCRQGSLQGIMRKGDGCSLSRILSTWEEKSGALYQEFSAHGSWEGKLGRVGVWEHGRVRPGSSAGVVGSRPVSGSERGKSSTKLDFVAAGRRRACWPEGSQDFMCSNLSLGQSRSVQRQ